MPGFCQDKALRHIVLGPLAQVIMLASTGLLVSLLAAEQHRGDLSPFLALADGSVRRVDRSLSDFPDAERPLVAAAVALAAGEPKRALRAMGNAGGSREIEEVAGALRLAAYTLDLNWYPGGGGAPISDGDIAAMTGEVPRPEDPGTKPGRADRGAADSARSIRSPYSRRLQDGRPARGGGVRCRGCFGSWVRNLRQSGAAGVLAYFWLALADVMRRAGRAADAADAVKSASTSPATIR